MSLRYLYRFDIITKIHVGKRQISQRQDMQVQQFTSWASFGAIIHIKQRITQPFPAGSDAEEVIAASHAWRSFQV